VNSGAPKARLTNQRRRSITFIVTATKGAPFGLLMGLVYRWPVTGDVRLRSRYTGHCRTGIWLSRSIGPLTHVISKRKTQSNAQLADCCSSHSSRAFFTGTTTPIPSQPRSHSRTGVPTSGCTFFRAQWFRSLPSWYFPAVTRTAALDDAIANLLGVALALLIRVLLFRPSR